MTKEELMQLADAYAKMYQQALSDAIDAALKKARRDALEESAKVCEAAWPVTGSPTADKFAEAIRALKEKA